MTNIDDHDPTNFDKDIDQLISTDDEDDQYQNTMQSGDDEEPLPDLDDNDLDTGFRATTEQIQSGD